MDATALRSVIPQGFGVLERDPVPALEDAFAAEVTESDGEKPFPLSFSGHACAANGLAMDSARLR